MNSQRKQMLQESIDYLKHDARMPSMAHAFIELLDDYEKLHARITELEKDAARYRWLHEKSQVSGNRAWLASVTARHQDGDYLRRGDALHDLERAIDAAMQKD